VREFWDRGWIGMRAAGSGGGVSNAIPDVIAIKNNDIIALQCKTTKSDRLSLKKDIMQLLDFSNISGARAYLAIKFHRKKPRFFKIDRFIFEDKYTVKVTDTYLTFDALICEQSLLR